MAAENPIDFARYITNSSVVTDAARSVRALGKSVTEAAKAVETDGTRIKAALDRINASVKEMQGTATRLNFGNEGDKKVLQEMIQELGLLKKAKEELRKSEEANANTQRALTEASKGATAALREQQMAFKAAVASGDTDGARKAAQALREIKSEADQAGRALRGGASAFTAAAGSVDELRLKLSAGTVAYNALSAAERENSVTGKQLTASNRALSDELKVVEGRVGDARRNIGAYGEAFKGAGTNVFSFLTQVGGGLLTLQGAVGLATSAFSTNSEFQSALSSLSALTGATGEDLQFMADKAQELGPAVGKSAAETLKAFELVGSAQPELLKSKDALVEVTAEALKLAAASGEDLPAAAAALTSVMNQFQAPAKEAARYVNALAAGAKEGAATIPQAADSMKYFGVNAASANVSIEQSVALIQVLAERSIKGEQAGVNLRNVFAKLASGAKDTNPEIVGLEKALDNLGKKNLSTAEYTKLFGLENANAAKILVESRDKVDTLTKAVTGTNVANEQAARQLDNVGAAGKRFFAILQNGAINGLGGLTKGFGSLLNTLSDVALRLSGVTKSFDDEIEASGKSIQANGELARSSQTLVNRYEELTAKGVKPTAKEKSELARITLQLRDNFGESITSIDKETGALILNLGATKELIKQKLLLSNQEASTLALRADKLAGDIKSQEALNRSLKLEIDTRRDGLAQQGVSAREADKLLSRQIELQSQGQKLRGYDLVAIEKFAEAQRQLALGEYRIADAQEKRRAILTKLAELGFSQADIEKLFSGAVDASTAALKHKGDAAAVVDAVLDRNAKAQAVNRAAELKGQLDQTQRQIEDIKKRQAEEAKLFDDQQISGAVFRASVATTQDQVTALERSASSTRIRILRAERDEKLIIIQDEALRERKTKGLGEAELLDIQQAAATKRLTVVQEYGRSVAKERDALQEKLKVDPIEFNVVMPEPRRVLSAYGALSSAIEQRASETQTFLNRQLALQRISRERFDLETLKNQQTALEKQLILEKKYGNSTTALQAQIEQNKNRQAELGASRRQRITQQAAEALSIIESTYFAFKSQQYAADLDALQRSRDIALRNAGENAVLKQKLTEEFDRKERAIKRRQAINDRDASLFQIAINTAVNASQYTPVNPLFYLAIASGLAQAALVYSKPLPAYFKGRENGPAEFALVAERGPELIESRTGAVRLAAKQGVEYLEAGDRVHTADQTQRILQRAHLEAQQLRHPLQLSSMLHTATTTIQSGRGDSGAGSSKQLEAITGKLDKAVLALQNQQHVRVNITDEGIRKALVDGKSLATRMNERLDTYL